MAERNYAFEALAEVTATDWEVGRGQLNAALKSIRAQTEIKDDYLLADEIHERGKMYRALWPEITLTPTALAKHWVRLPEELKNMKRGGSNLHAGVSKPLPPTRREQNLEEARKILAKFQ